MSEFRFGTDHERYLGSGIVFLSQIVETSPGDCSLCKREQREIESQFQRGACKPWLPEFHLKAEIPESQWETRDILEERRFERYDLPKLWFQDADIRIVEKKSVARYEAAKSSGASELKEMFNLLETEERWWVVDFFKHGKVIRVTRRRTEAAFC
jgi:DNA-directed RNA polymerase subunit H (RpoH/RPB5)